MFFHFQYAVNIDIKSWDENMFSSLKKHDNTKHLLSIKSTVWLTSQLKYRFAHFAPYIRFLWHESENALLLTNV